MKRDAANIHRIAVLKPKRWIACCQKLDCRHRIGAKALIVSLKRLRQVDAKMNLAASEAHQRIGTNRLN